MKDWVVACFLASALMMNVQAQERLISPGQGTPERKAVLDAVRPAVEQKLKGEVVFVVREIRVYKNWAFVFADPQRKDGKKFDSVRLFGKETSQMMDGLTVTALLQRSGSQWVLVDHWVGATDVWWSSYCDDNVRKVPKEVLGVCPS
jgi:hypothetical protein